MTITDCNNAKSFAKVGDELLIESGMVYYKHMAQLPSEIKSKLTYDAEDPFSVPSNISFLKDATNLYDTNPKFRNSLVVGFLKDTVNRADGTRNAEMDEKVINFYRFVATYIPKAAMDVSENLQGPGKRWRQKLNAQERISCILDDDHKIIASRMKKAAADRAIDDKTPVIFSLVIDATKVAKLCKVSSTYKAIIGGAHPNHKVDVHGLSKDDINAIINGT